MKAYITPVENYCNASCVFCITNIKKESNFGSLIDIKNLKKLEEIENIDCYEISGGGEPLLHPEINKILSWSTKRKPTILYTNGSLIKNLQPEIAQKLAKLTISHHHFDPVKRLLLMGVPLDVETLNKFVKNGVYLRFTLVLVKGGIANAQDLAQYLDWAKEAGAKEVQVRQLFDYDYCPKIKELFVSTDLVLDQLASEYELLIKKGKYKTIKWKEMPVEFEGSKCACASGVPNLRANGHIYKGWSNTKYL